MSYVVTIGVETMTTNINQGIDIFLEDMVKDGQITEDQRMEMMRYRVVVHETGFWGSIWKTVFKGKSDGWFYSTVRLVRTAKELDEEKEK